MAAAFTLAFITVGAGLALAIRMMLTGRHHRLAWSLVIGVLAVMSTYLLVKVAYEEL